MGTSIATWIVGLVFVLPLQASQEKTDPLPQKATQLKGNKCFVPAGVSPTLENKTKEALYIVVRYKMVVRGEVVPVRIHFSWDLPPGKSLQLDPSDNGMELEVLKEPHECIYVESCHHMF